jgi:hypothetical protein
MRAAHPLASLPLAVVALAACSKADVRTDVPAKIEGANVEVGESNTNGLAIANLSCKSEGGLLASMGILGGLGAKGDALQTCAGKPEKVRVHFAYAGGNTSDVRVADASVPGVAQCVSSVLVTTTLPESGTCIATITVGRPGVGVPEKPSGR